MFLILITCLIWLPALLGLGTFILRLHDPLPQAPALQQICLSGLYGLFTLSILGTIANFFIGLYPVLPLIVAAAGWGLFIARRRDFVGLRPSHAFAIAAVLLLVTLADARGRIRYDTGLYHLQAVKWITSQPAPLGLANLYGRLGFNSAWFPAAAMLETPGLREKSTFILNALLMILFGSALLDSAQQLARHGFNRADAFLLLAIYPWAAYGFDTDYASSLHPDFPVMLLTCFVGMLWLSDKDGRDYSSHAVTLSIFAVMIKLSAAPLLIGAIAIWIFRQWRYRRQLKIIPLLTVWVLALLAWTIRGVILSGCLFYPSTIGRIPAFRWTVPLVRMHYEVELIRDWGRYWMIPEHVTPGQPWLRAWAHRLRTEPYASEQEMKVMLGLLTIGIFLAIIPASWPRMPIRKWIPLLVIAALGIAYWFLTAPDPRFGYGYLFAFAAGVFCLGLERLSKRKQFISMIGCGAVFVVLLRGYAYEMKEVTLLHWPSIPKATLTARQNEQGITMYIPTGDDRPWAAPLPASPFFDPALRCTVDDKGQFREFWLDPSAHVLAMP